MGENDLMTVKTKKKLNILQFSGDVLNNMSNLFCFVYFLNIMKSDLIWCNKTFFLLIKLWKWN